MSLNKFTALQIGQDLALKIGCQDLKAAENIECKELIVNGVPFKNDPEIASTYKENSNDVIVIAGAPPAFAKLNTSKTGSFVKGSATSINVDDIVIAEAGIYRVEGWALFTPSANAAFVELALGADVAHPIVLAKDTVVSGDQVSLSFSDTVELPNTGIYGLFAYASGPINLTVNSWRLTLDRVADI